MKSVIVLNCLRCFIAFAASFYFSLVILTMGLLGTYGRSFTDIFTEELWLMLLCGVVIAIIPKPTLLPVAAATLPMPLFVQYAVIGGAFESNKFDDWLWLSSPTLVYLVLIAPIAIRRLIESMKLEKDD